MTGHLFTNDDWLPCGDSKCGVAAAKDRVDPECLGSWLSDWPEGLRRNASLFGWSEGDETSLDESKGISGFIVGRRGSIGPAPLISGMVWRLWTALLFCIDIGVMFELLSSVRPPAPTATDRDRVS